MLTLAKRISPYNVSVSEYSVEQAAQFVALQAKTAALEAAAAAATAAATAQAARITTLEAVVKTLSQPPAPTPGVQVGTTRVFIPAGDSIQAAVNAAPDGTCFTLGRGIHPFTGPVGIDTSKKNAVRFDGEGGCGYNEGGRWGVVLRGLTSGMVIHQDLGAGANVKHSGARFSNINFHAAGNDITAIKTRQVNHWSYKNCAVQGHMVAAFDIDIPTILYDQGDNAYNLLESVWITNTKPNAAGFLMGDGLVWLTHVTFDMAGDAPTGLKNLRGNMKLHQCKWNHAGTLIYWSGGAGSVGQCIFEWAPAGPNYMVHVEQGTNRLPGAGCYLKVIDNDFIAHDDALPAGAKAAYFGSGTYGNKLVENTYLNFKQGVSVIDRGANKIVID